MIYAPASSKATIVMLVSRQKWHQLADILRRVDDRRNLPMAFDARSTKDRLPEEHIVHLACHNRAPCKIIEMLADRYPKSPSAADNSGRYPLHIACAKGLKPKIVDFLLRSHPQAAGVQDDYGKTPLRYVCESYACNFRTIPGNAGRSPERSLLNVVSLLWNARVPQRGGSVRDEHHQVRPQERDGHFCHQEDAESKISLRDEPRQAVPLRHLHGLTSFNSLTMSSDNNDGMHRESEAKGAPLLPTRIDRTEANMQVARSA